MFAAVAAAWVVLGVLSSERKQRVAEIELSLALDRTRKAADAAQSKSAQPTIELAGPQH